MNSPILLIAGWAQEKEALSPMARLFHDAGPSVFISACSLAGEDRNYAENLAHTIRSMSTPPIIIGWSMGGMIALEALARHTPPARALVLISSTARFRKMDDYPFGIPERSVKAMQIGLDTAPVKTLTTFFRALHAPDSVDEEILTQQVEKAVMQGTDTLKQGLNYLIETDLRDALPEIHVPALILHGEKDRIISFHASEYLANALPQGRLWLNRKAGHALPLRMAAPVAETISAFLEDRHENGNTR